MFQVRELGFTSFASVPDGLEVAACWHSVGGRLKNVGCVLLSVLLLTIISPLLSSSVDNSCSNSQPQAQSMATVHLTLNPPNKSQSFEASMIQ